MLNLSRFTAFALLALASPAASQMLVTVPKQYQGRWAQNCDVGWSISITERDVGGIKIRGLVENLPGHILITQAGSQISLFPQMGSNGRKLMMSMTPKGEAEEVIGIMNICGPVPAPMLQE